METHWDRYCRLQQVRTAFCQRPRGASGSDIAGRVVHVDGKAMRDVPSFYLHLGEAIHGPEGYFGGGLHALGDCLCGGFGIKPPLTIVWAAPDAARSGLDHAARVMFHAAIVHSLTLEPDPGMNRIEWITDLGWIARGREEADLARWARIHHAANEGGTPDRARILKLSDGIYDDNPGTYMDDVLDVLLRHGGRVQFRA